MTSFSSCSQAGVMAPMRLKRSKVWLHFTKKDDNRVTCNTCATEISSKGGNTSNMKKHLQARHAINLAESQFGCRPAGKVTDEPDQADGGEQEEGEGEEEAAASAPQRLLGGNRKCKRSAGRKAPEIEEYLLRLLKRRANFTPPPPCEDELFMISLIPSLKRLPSERKEYVKFQFHKLIYEASTVTLNLDQLDH